MSLLCKMVFWLKGSDLNHIYFFSTSMQLQCNCTFSGRRKFLCKGECRDEDVLVQTDGDRAQRGRYSIIYKEGTFPVSSSVLFVGITQLTKSDSGRYWCVLERPFFPDSYSEFEIRVTDGEFLYNLCTFCSVISSLIAAVVLNILYLVYIYHSTF